MNTPVNFGSAPDLSDCQFSVGDNNRSMTGAHTTLFLDFDGVTHPLHCHESKQFSCLAGIEDTLRRFPDVEVVISSTWRLQYPLERLQEWFATDIRCRVIDVTPVASRLPSYPDRLVSFPRHHECWSWMRLYRQASDNWLALDDRPFLFQPFFADVVPINGRTGVDADALSELRRRLLLKAKGR